MNAKDVATAREFKAVLCTSAAFSPLWCDSVWGLASRVTRYLCTLAYFRHKEAYTWTNPTCCVHNVIIGKLWIEQYGTVEILNHR